MTPQIVGELSRQMVRADASKTERWYRDTARLTQCVITNTARVTQCVMKTAGVVLQMAFFLLTKFWAVILRGKQAST